MIIAVVGGILWYVGYPGYILWAAAFGIYNIPHLMMRWIGLVQGYQYGVNIYKNLNFESHKKLYKLYLNLGRSSIVVLLGLIVYFMIAEFGANGLLLFINIPVISFINKFSQNLIIIYIITFLLNIILGIIII